MNDKPIYCEHCGPAESMVDIYQDDVGYWSVVCGACGSHSGTRPPSDPDGKQKVIDSWNKRTYIPTEEQLKVHFEWNSHL